MRGNRVYQSFGEKIEIFGKNMFNLKEDPTARTRGRVFLSHE